MRGHKKLTYLITSVDFYWYNILNKCSWTACTLLNQHLCDSFILLFYHLSRLDFNIKLFEDTLVIEHVQCIVSSCETYCTRLLFFVFWFLFFWFALLAICCNASSSTSLCFFPFCKQMFGMSSKQSIPSIVEDRNVLISLGLYCHITTFSHFFF